MSTSFWTYQLDTHTQKYFLFNYLKNKYDVIVFSLSIFSQLGMCA